MSKTFLIGSRYFFDGKYEDFVSKDTDVIALVDNPPYQHMRQVTGSRKCYFEMRRHSSVEPYIEWALKSNTGMVVGKFLVPEFCEAIGFKVEDLPRLQPLIDRLDDKHKYEKIIYDSYIENKAFVLTKEQLDKAYSSYKISRSIEK